MPLEARVPHRTTTHLDVGPAALDRGWRAPLAQVAERCPTQASVFKAPSPSVGVPLSYEQISSRLS
jgi:hypothetical protein